MKPHAGACDRVQVGGLRHQVNQPPARSAKGSASSAMFSGSRRSRKADRSTSGPGPPVRRRGNRPSDTRERRGVVLNSGQAHGHPERQPIRANSVAHKPAEVCRLHHREPVPPAVRATVQTVIQRANPASHGRDGRNCLPLPSANRRGLRFHAALPSVRAADNLAPLPSDRAGTTGRLQTSLQALPHPLNDRLADKATGISRTARYGSQAAPVAGCRRRTCGEISSRSGLMWHSR